MNLERFTTTHQVVVDVLRGHPLYTALSMTVEVPDIYLQQFWYTVDVETRDEDTIVAMVDQTEVTVTLDELRQLLHLPEATNAGRVRFSTTLGDEQMLREIHELGHNGPIVDAMDLVCGKLQPVWYTLFTILNRCLSSKTKVIGKGTTTFYHLFHAVAYDRHVDYCASTIPFMRFFQIIIRAHMDHYPEIRRCSSYPLAPNY